MRAAVAERLEVQERRVLTEFCKQYELDFQDLDLLKLALTHRSYLSVTGQGPRESNERLEFLGDSVLGLVTSEFLYRRHPEEHEGQLTKTKSLLVSKAILSRRALKMGLGRYVLLSHSEVESGGRQRLSILADAFESVLGAIYLDQGFERARAFIHQHLLSEADAIVADKRHTNYKSHLQEYVQSTFRTHPVYRIRSEYGPDHSKHFMVEVMVGKRTLGEGRGHNKKEAEQAAARDALDRVEGLRRSAESEGGSRRSRSVEDDAAGTRAETRAPRHADRFGEPEGSGRARRRRDGAEGVESDDRPARRRSRRADRLEPAPAAGEGEVAEEVPVDDRGDRLIAAEVSNRRARLAPLPEEWPPEPPAEPHEAGEAVPATESRGLEVESESGTPIEPIEPSRPRASATREVETPMSWGRGRRRGASPPRSEPAADREAPDTVTLSEASVDPFAHGDDHRREVLNVEPDSSAALDAEPVPSDAAVPTEDEREARIEEIEQALASFGRRSQKLGRRSRRR